MSLDVYLTLDGAQVPVEPDRIFIREDGQTKAITRAEWDARYPDHEPVTVTAQDATTDEVYHANITHNLGAMARAAGLYEVLWQPDEVGITQAAQLIEPLRTGLARLRAQPDLYRPFEATNGWGTYAQFVPFVQQYLEACEASPTAHVRVWR